MGARFIKLGQISIDLLDLFNNGTSTQKQVIKDLLKRTSSCDYKTQVLGGLTAVDTTANPDTLFSVIWNEVRRNNGLAIQLPPCYRYQFNADALPYGMSSQYLGEATGFVQLQFGGSAFKDPTWYEQVASGAGNGYIAPASGQPVLKAYFPDTNQTSEHIVNVHLNLGFTGGGKLVPINQSDIPNYDPRNEVSFTVRAKLTKKNTSSSSDTIIDMFTGSITHAQIAAGETIPVHAHMRMTRNGGFPTPLTIDGQALIGDYDQLEVFLQQDSIGAIVPVVNSAGVTTGSRSGALNMIKAAPVTSDLRDSSNYAEIIKLLT